MAATGMLARLLGPSIIVTVLAEFYNGSVFRDKSAHVVFFNGNVLFIAGLALVQSHNVWRTWSATLVSTVSWAILLLGLARMINPAGTISVDLEDEQEGSMTVVLLCLIGALLTVAGYREG